MSVHSAKMLNRLELPTAVTCWFFCSLGMLIFNKLAISAVPRAPCTLVVVQFAFTVVVLLVFCWKSIHIGSLTDVLRWCKVVPFFVGMIITSILSLRVAPMTLVITFRSMAPLMSLAVERFFPDPMRLSWSMMASMIVMQVGVGLYIADIHDSSMTGAGYALLNSCLAIGDRLLQRLMLAKEQQPVDISKTGATLLLNLLGIPPLAFAAVMTGELEVAWGLTATMSRVDMITIFASCVAGVGISYSGIWVQSMISATSYLVLINSNKFIIILLEILVLREKGLTHLQILGPSVSILASALYGKAREHVEHSTTSSTKEVEDGELQKIACTDEESGEKQTGEQDTSEEVEL